jgi:hypothetical protein
LRARGRAAVIVAAAVALTGLTGCGGGRPGVAAVALGQTITEKELEIGVAQINDHAFGPGAVTPGAAIFLAGLSRAVTTAAAEQGVPRATDEEVVTFLQSIVPQANDQLAAQGAEGAEAAQEITALDAYNSVALDIGRWQLLSQQVQEGTLDGEAINAVITELIADPDSLQLNPRFGQVDFQSETGFVPVSYPWLTEAVADVAATQ